MRFQSVVDNIEIREMGKSVVDRASIKAKSGYPTDVAAMSKQNTLPGLLVVTSKSPCRQPCFQKIKLRSKTGRSSFARCFSTYLLRMPRSRRCLYPSNTQRHTAADCKTSSSVFESRSTLLDRRPQRIQCHQDMAHRLPRCYTHPTVFPRLLVWCS